MPFNVVLFEPEIAPNTGNIIRLCANIGCHLQLIEPLGFDWDDKKLRRAGLDYREWASVERLADFAAFEQQRQAGSSLWAFTTKAGNHYHSASIKRGDSLLFGPETRGLPSTVLNQLDEAQKLRLPMVADSRSLNLSNCVAIAAFEAWRQLDFCGGN